MSLTGVIDIAFRHGLGDCVHLAHVLELYRRRGFGVRVTGDKSKEGLWRLLGIETGHGAAPAHDWSYPDGWSDPSGQDARASKIAFNLNRPPLPDLGDRQALWEELLALRLGVRARIPEWAWRDVDAFLAERPRPLVLLHANGHSAIRDKDLPLNLMLATQILLADRGFGVVVLDWDRRSPVLGLPEICSIQDRWPRMPLECLAALQYRADVMVGIDSGPLHFASLTDVPCVGIWRRHLPSRSGLPNPRSVHLVPRALATSSSRGRSSRWVMIGYALGEPSSVEILNAVEQLLDRCAGSAWRSRLDSRTEAGSASLAGVWALAPDQDLPDRVLADAPLVEITEGRIASVDGVGVSREELEAAWGGPLEYHVNRSRELSVAFAFLAVDRASGERIELGLTGAARTGERIELETFVSGVPGATEEEASLNSVRILRRLQRPPVRAAPAADPLLAALRLGTWRPDLASHELEQLVDLPTPEARRAAAGRLAAASGIATPELLEAMRRFGSSGEMQQGSFQVTAAIWTGRELQDCRIRVLVPDSYQPGAPLLLLVRPASVPLEVWEAVAEEHGMPLVAPELPGETREAQRLALLDVLRWARRHFDVDEARIFLRAVDCPPGSAEDLAWPCLDLFASVADLSEAESAGSDLAGFDTARRNPLPERIVACVANEPLRRYWLEVQPCPGGPAEVEVERLERGRIRVRREGTAALRLLLTESMLDESGELIVEVDGAPACHAPALDRGRLLEDFAERFDRLFLPTHGLSISPS